MAAITLSLLLCHSVGAQTTYTSIASGNWNDASTWSPSGVPSSTSPVIILGHTITVSANASCASVITRGASSGASVLSINSGSKLTLSGNFIVEPTNAYNNDTYINGFGRIEVNSLQVGFATINNSFPTSTRLTTLYVDDLNEFKINQNLISTTPVNTNPIAFNESRVRHRSGLIDLVGLLSVSDGGSGPFALGYRTDNDNQGNSTIVFRNANPTIPTDVQKAPSFTGGTVEFNSTATSGYTFPSLAYKNVILNSNRTFTSGGSSTSVITGGRFELKQGVFTSSAANQLRINDGVTVVRSGGSFASGINSRLRLTNATNKYNVTYEQHSSSIIINDLPAYFPGNTLINSIKTVTINSTNGVTLNNNTIQIENLIVNVSCTVLGTGKVFVTGLFDVPSASSIIFPDNFLKLLSNTNGSARVAQFRAGTAVTGKVVVDLFLPNLSRSWRLLTAPVKGSTVNSVWENWQNNGVYNGTDIGVDLWGPDGSLEAQDTGSTIQINNPGNGLTLINNSSYNMRKFDNASGTWSNVRNTLTQPLFTSAVNSGFLIFATNPFLGASDLAGVGSTGSSQTTLSASGQLIIGDVVHNNISSNRFYLIGNPYVSPIDFAAILRENGNTGVNKIWVIDPTIGLGSYVTWDAVAGYSNTDTSFSNNTILQSGQAFFVRASSAPTSLTIKESHKSNLISNSTLNRAGNSKAGVTSSLFRIQLDKDVMGRFKNVDGCVVAFYDGGDNSLDASDARKLFNPSENIAIINNNFNLSIEHRAPIADNEVVKLRITDGIVGVKYKLKLSTNNFVYQGLAYLQDAYNSNIIEIPLDGSVFEYSFQLTADAASVGDRFSIIFKPDVSLGVFDGLFDDEIDLYPNPVDIFGSVKLSSKMELTGENLGYRIHNMSGQLVLEGLLVFKGGAAEIHLNSKLPSGIYVVQIINKVGSRVYTKKIIIR